MTEELASSPQTLKFGELNSGTDHASLGEVVSTSEETVDQTQIDQWLKDGTLVPDGKLFQEEGPPVSYVEANSPEEAVKKLDALESPLLIGTAAATKYGPCILKPEYLHLRKSGGYETVGYKTKTTCTSAVTSVKHETDLRRKFMIWWKKAGNTTTSVSRGEKSLYQQNVKFTCKNTKATNWSGTTLGTIVYKGKNYFARVYAPVKKLACGA
ncbi:hypothetical protein [Glutamicibacter sp. JC586]|uniref:hypothetical protein n=1 Tax=Glutamicibacter sp. JC586 TaxID=2590552 RepID=UPI00135B8092|nr:hypothetical protein [Glutamicibacter sp. JC586]